MDVRRWLATVLCAFPLLTACDSGSGQSGSVSASVTPGDCNGACNVMTSCLGMDSAECLTGCQTQMSKSSGQQTGDAGETSTQGNATNDDACWACFNFDCSRCKELRACLVENCSVPSSAMDECKEASGTTGQVTSGKPTSLEAQAVGAWSQVSSTCSSSSVLTGYGYFLCPGGRIRGAGKLGNTTELLCGTYTVTPASMPDCTDKVGCFPKVHATVKDTLVLGGQQDVDPSYAFTMLIRDDAGATTLYKDTQCGDGSAGYILLSRVAGDVGDDYCVSSACPATGSSSGAYGSCGTDCDCGTCWYCESGQCRYGGEGPYGCYRGCSG